MPEYGTVYAASRRRLTELVGGLDEAGQATIVPTCPEWRVKDVIAHLTGIIDDIGAGRLDGVGTDPWTAVQVEARRDTPLAEILAEWEAKAPPIEAMADNVAQMGQSLVGDITTHELDVRAALGQSGPADDLAVNLTLDRYAPTLAQRAKEAGVAPVRIVADGRELPVEGEPGATVSASTFELVRAITGRRSTAQIAAFDWTGDSSPYLPIFSTYGSPSADVIE